MALPTGRVPSVLAARATGSFAALIVSTDRYAVGHSDRGAVDAILDPADTRAALLTALEVATRYDEGRAFKTGVLQV